VREATGRGQQPNRGGGQAATASERKPPMTTRRLLLSLGLLLALSQGPLAAQDAKPADPKPGAADPKADEPKAKSGKTTEIDLAGATFGLTTDEVKTLARQKGKKLVGPDKRVIDASGIQVSGLSVDKNGNLAGQSGIERQTLMLLGDKLIAVELIYKSKGAFDKFIEQLKDLGYEEKEEGYYVGKLQTGAYQGREVEVRTSGFKGGGKATRQKYEAVVRCLKVLGENATEAYIRAAQVREPTKEGKAAVDALKGMTK
jgi:hypothetical protein